MLKITRLNTIFDMFDSENEALQAYTQATSGAPTASPS
jgi:hypothetical protein